MPRYSLLQAIGIVTVFALAFGVWHSSSFDVGIAVVVALGCTAILLTGARSRRISLVARSVASIAVGLIAADLYAYRWGDELKQVQILVAIVAAISCWALLSWAIMRTDKN